MFLPFILLPILCIKQYQAEKVLASGNMEYLYLHAMQCSHLVESVPQDDLHFSFYIFLVTK